MVDSKDNNISRTVINGGELITSSTISPRNIQTMDNVIKPSQIISVREKSIVESNINSSGNLINTYQDDNVKSLDLDTRSVYSIGTINIYSNESIVSSIITSDATVNVYDGGYISYDSLVYDGGVINVYGGAIYANLSNGGVINAYSGTIEGYQSGGILNLGGFGEKQGSVGAVLDLLGSDVVVNVGAGANVLIHSFERGTINVLSGGFIDYIIYDGYGVDNERIYVNSHGSVGSVDLYNIYMQIRSGGFVDTTKITAGGTVVVEGSANNIKVGDNEYGGGTVSVNNGGGVNTLQVNSRGSVVINSGGSLTGTLTLGSGGSVKITTSTGGIIDLVGDENAGLVIYGSANAGQNISATTVISNFSGINTKKSDHITLADVHKNDIASVTFPDNDHITLTLTDNSSITLNILNIKTTGYSLNVDDHNELTLAVCFLTGTMIETPSGICAVEDLYVGDLVLVYDPVTQTKISAPITWVGHKKTSVNPNRLNDEAGYPVRILKDAIAENVPNKDLLITPEHCLFFDGKFIPARMLVNGYSIFYDMSMTSYEYYHIETKNHSILTADGMLTESYLDTGNRHVFNQDQKVIELSGDNVKTWEQDAIAPLTTEVSIVEPIYNDILQRATQNECVKQSQSFKVIQDPDVYLMTDQGQIIHKKANSTDKKVSFIIPNDVDAVWIMSRTSRPCDVIGSYVDDRRYLGVLVGDITLQRNGKNQNITTHIEADHLSGWDVKEAVPCRWTKGKALLLLNVKSRSRMPSTLTLTIFSNHSYIVDHEENHKKLVS